MMENHIGCNVESCGDTGPFSIEFNKVGNAISLTSSVLRQCSKGLSLQGRVVFDMQEDGGVDSIELLSFLGNDLRNGIQLPSRKLSYGRLFLNPIGDFQEHHGNIEFVPDMEVSVQRLGNFAVFRFGRQVPLDREWLIGAGTVALLGAGKLLGLRIDVSPFLG